MRPLFLFSNIFIAFVSKAATLNPTPDDNRQECVFTTFNDAVTSRPMSDSPINIHIFSDTEYIEAFEIWSGSTNEKFKSTRIVGEFLQRLGAQNFWRSSTLSIADIGSSNCATSVKYLQRANLGNVDLYPIDVNSVSITQARANGHANAVVGNIYDGKISQQMRLPHRMDLAFVNHVFYSAERHDIETAFCDVISHVVSEEGFAVIVHANDQPDGITDLRNRFGPKAFNTNPSTLVRELCAVHQFPIMEYRYQTKDYVENMSDAEWSMFEIHVNCLRVSHQSDCSET